MSVVLALFLTGCGVQIPVDTHGTLQRISGATLRVGVSPNPPWTQAREGESPSGREVELILKFAAVHGAGVEWTEGGEETLMGRLDHGDLDIVIGGLTSKSPWSDKAALTQSDARSPAPTTGEVREHVMASRMGENALLFALESFLLEQGRQS